MPSVIHGLFIAFRIVVFGMSSLHALSIETLNVSKNKEKSGLFGLEPISEYLHPLKWCFKLLGCFPLLLKDALAWTASLPPVDSDKQ